MRRAHQDPGFKKYRYLTIQTVLRAEIKNTRTI